MDWIGYFFLILNSGALVYLLFFKKPTNVEKIKKDVDYLLDKSAIVLDGDTEDVDVVIMNKNKVIYTKLKERKK